MPAPPRAEPAARRSRLLALLVAAAAAVAIVGAFLLEIDRPFGNSDEAIYAEFIRSMHRTGRYHELRYGSGVVFQRPPAPIALYAAVARLVDGEAGMRLVPALLSALAAVLAGLITLRTFRRLDAALVASLLCASLPTYYTYGRALSSDPPFVLACTAALGLAMALQEDPRWLRWTALALGLTFATKSLAGGVAVLALAPWILLAAWRFRARRELRPGLSASLFVAAASPYYLLGYLAHRGDFLEGHFGFNLIRRARGEIEGVGEGGPFFYFEHILGRDGVVSALVLLVAVVGAAVLAARRRDRALAVPATYAVVTLLSLSAVGSRTGHYLLPFYPAVAVCAAGLLVRLVPGKWTASPVHRLVAPAAALAALVVTIGEPGVDPALEPSTETLALARAAAEVTAPDERVWSLDWYGPALGYYADRPWGLLTTSERAARIVGAVDVFEKAGTVVLAPPWPEGRLVLAAAPSRLAVAGAAGLRSGRALHRTPHFVLVEVPARGPDRPSGSGAGRAAPAGVEAGPGEPTGLP